MGDTRESEPKAHLVGRVREALAEDPRTNALDIQVTIAGSKLFLLGQATSREAREAAALVARELVPAGMPVVNALTVEALLESTEAEWVP